MQMVRRFLVSLFSLWIAILLFMPKQELYYFMEHKLVKYDLKFNEKSITTHLVGMSIKDLDIYLSGMHIAKVDTCDIKTILLTTTIDMKDIEIDNSFDGIVPRDIQSVILSYSLWNPFVVTVWAKGDFGTVRGYISMDGLIHLDFVEQGDIHLFQKELKKGQNGWYYEEKI
jgi:hypothetical protein